MEENTNAGPSPDDWVGTMQVKELVALPRPVRPANAYELLERVCEATLAEPKRYDQTQWVKLTARNYDRPACGTVGCRAGWICLIERTTRIPSVDKASLKELDNALDDLRYHQGDMVPGNARNLLGCGRYDAPDDLREAVTWLFSGDALHFERGDTTDEETGDWSQELPEQGTMEYAKLGVEGLRAFMARFEGWLKSLSLPGVEA